MRLNQLVLATCFISSSLLLSAENKVSYIASGAGWPPFLVPKGEKLSGIIPGILQQATTKFSYNMVHDYRGLDDTHAGMDTVSGKRGDIKGKVMCTGPTTIEWTPKEMREKIYYTAPLLKSKQVIIFAKGKIPAGKKTIADLKGMTISGCKGYRYPNFDAWVDSKAMKRVDNQGAEGRPCEAPTVQSIIDGKADFAAVDEHVLAYMGKKKWVDLSKLETYPVIDSTVELRMLCTKNDVSKDFVAKLEGIIDDMSEKGRIVKIVNKFVGKKLAH